MKKILNAHTVLSLCSAFFLFFGCNISSEKTTIETYEENSIEATSANTWEYDSTKPIYQVDSSVLSLKITNLSAASGKTLYLVKANPSEYSISNQRTISSVSSIASSEVLTRTQEENSIQYTDDIEIPQPKYRHFVPSVDLTELQKSITVSAARSTTNSLSAATQITREVGTTKSIYIDTNWDGNDLCDYATSSATLRAVGTYCNVWVVDKYYESSVAKNNKVNSEIAQNLAEKFDLIYPYITNVFGDESNELSNVDSNLTKIDMGTYSDTGTYINIVIYDIGADYKSESTSGVVGYFYAKDYYYTKSSNRKDIYGTSNIGKYFYVDSAYAVDEFNIVVSTLAHEFQHMVNYNQKNILHSKSPSTQYNEMLSMLCEDMMQEKLGLDDEDSPKNRLQYFNAYYYLSGLTEYNSSYATCSYSNSYAFGTWLCRQYGGAALAKEMSTNEYVNNESIVAAVNTINETSYTFDDLFMQFLLALTGSSTYTFNQDAAQTISYGTDGYKYPMNAINLWSEDYSLAGTDYAKNNKKSAYSNYNFFGPMLFSYKSTSVSALRPQYGFSLHGVTKILSSYTTKTVKFSNSGSSDLVMYLIIQ